MSNLIFKHISKFAFIFICCFIFWGCHQNPFHNYPVDVQQAIPYSHLIEQLNIGFENKIVSENFAKTQTSEVWRVSVGNDFEMVVVGQVFLDEMSFDDFEIDLILPPPRNEKYTFDEVAKVSHREKRYLFKWSPSEHFLGDQDEKVVLLKFQLHTAGILNVQKEAYFPLFVSRIPQARRLEIISIEAPSSIQLGDSKRITVQVFDEDSSMASPPLIEFSGVEGDSGLIPLVSFVERKETSEFHWEFEFDVRTEFFQDFIGASTYTLHFMARSASQSHAFSDEASTKLTVVNNNDDFVPNIEGPQSITIYQGTQNHLSWRITDRFTNEGTLSVKLVNLNPVLEEQIQLLQKADGGGLDVSLIWDLPLDQETSARMEDLGRYDLDLEVTSVHQINEETIYRKFIHRISFWATSIPNKLESEL